MRYAITPQWMNFTLALAITALATPAKGIVVPDSECPCSPNPIMHDPQCSYDFVCSRVDSAPYIQSPGTMSSPTGQVLVCDTCCPDCDCASPPTETHVCTGQVSISLTRSFSYSVASGIEAGIPGIKASIQQSFGFGGSTTQQWSVTAGSSSFPSCRIGRYTVSVATMVGAVHAINHSYSWSTVLVSGPQPPCGGGGFLNNCFQTRISTGTSNDWGSASMKWLGNQNCP